MIIIFGGRDRKKNVQKVPLWNFLLSSNIWAPDCFQLHSITLQHSSCLLMLFLDALSSLAHLYQNRNYINILFVNFVCFYWYQREEKICSTLTFNFNTAKAHRSPEFVFNTTLYLFVMVSSCYVIYFKILLKMTSNFFVVNIPLITIWIRRRICNCITSKRGLKYRQ